MRDRGGWFVDIFDEVFRGRDMKILNGRVRAAVANTYAERWIGTLRRDLLDRRIVWNRRQLERLVVDHIDSHYGQIVPANPAGTQ